VLVRLIRSAPRMTGLVIWWRKPDARDRPLRRPRQRDRGGTLIVLDHVSKILKGNPCAICMCASSRCGGRRSWKLLPAEICERLVLTNSDFDDELGERQLARYTGQSIRKSPPAGLGRVRESGAVGSRHSIGLRCPMATASIELALWKPPRHAHACGGLRLHYLESGHRDTISLAPG
jgi:hypothetical protein